MDSGRPGERAEVFRPFLILPVLMALAGLLWVGVLIYLLTFDGVPPKIILSTVFFIAFFGVSLAYYVRSAIYIEQGGITYRGMIRTRWFSWNDIRKIEVLPGPITVYAIRTSGALCHFTSFFRNHRRLADVLVERAGLAGAM
ncbi:MAG: PH domain-containing protein [Myxococcaceae bacterium]